MKICPCCKSVTFDDMDVCYGCLYEFPAQSSHLVVDGVARGDVGDTGASDATAHAEAFDGPHPEPSVEEPVLRALETVDERGTIELQTRVVDRRFGADALVQPKSKQSRFSLQVPGEDDRELVLPEEEGFSLAIGRASDNAVVVHDLSVSRHHARLSYEGGAYMVEDLKTTNFTLLDGIPLLEPHRFEQGETLDIGASRMSYVADSSEEEPADLLGVKGDAWAFQEAIGVVADARDDAAGRLAQ